MPKDVDLEKIESLSDRRFSAGGTVTLQAAPAGDDTSESRPTITIDAYSGGPIRPFRPYLPAPMVIELSGVTKPDTGIVILLDHDDTQIVGQSTGIDISDGGIKVTAIATGDVSDKNDPAGKVVMHAKNGFTWKASVDMEIERLEEVEPGASVVVNGRAYAGPLYVVRASKLDGVSLLSIGADRTTSAKIAARAAKEQDMEFHDWLKAKEFDPSALTDNQRDTLLKQYESENRVEEVKVKAGGKPTQKDFDLSDLKAKRDRQNKIREHVVKYAEEYPSEIELIEAAGGDAIRLDQSPEMFELSLLRTLRGAPVANNTLRPAAGKEKAIDPKVFEAGLCMAGKLPNIDKHYDEKVLEAADKRWRTGIGLGQLMIYAAKANSNEEFMTSRDVAPLLRAAFSGGDRSIRAASGPSNFDIGNILSNVANKFIVNYFNSVDNTWRGIAKTKPVNDFKSYAGYALNGDFQYDEIAPGGEIKHGTLGETAYSNQAKTYGKMFAIDRRDIVNDDLDAFMSVASRLGRGGALKLNQIFWSVFMDNSTFFTTARGNAYANAAAALSISALEYAETLFMNMTDPDGQPLAVMPSRLLVPPALKRTALRLMNSTEIRQLADSDASSDVGMYGTANTFNGDFGVLSTPYLSNSAYTGYSASTWYLLANQNDMPVIEVVFLNGVERPTVESAQADFDTLGVKMRGYFDFGVALQEYRGGVRMSLS